jgi:hypothetical protein
VARVINRISLCRAIPAIDRQMVIVDMHVIVHVRSHEAEAISLVPHQGLVVGLCITDCFFTLRLVSSYQRLFHGPVFIPRVFGEPDPVIGYTHGKAIIEADAARRVRAAPGPAFR